MSLLNLATVFGPSLLRPPVGGLGPDGPAMDISQEVVVQVSLELRSATERCPKAKNASHLREG